MDARPFYEATQHILENMTQNKDIFYCEQLTCHPALQVRCQFYYIFSNKRKVIGHAIRLLYTKVSFIID